MARTQHVRRRGRVIVPSIPSSEDVRRAFGGLCAPWRIGIKLRRRLFQIQKLGLCDLFNQGLPTVTIAQEYQKIRPRRNLLRPAEFVEADLHRAVIQTRLSGDAPAQIDGMELKSTDHAVLLQPGKHVALKEIALLLQIAEGRTDKDANDRPEAWDHRPAPFTLRRPNSSGQGASSGTADVDRQRSNRSRSATLPGSSRAPAMAASKSDSSGASRARR